MCSEEGFVLLHKSCIDFPANIVRCIIQVKRQNESPRLNREVLRDVGDLAHGSSSLGCPRSCCKTDSIVAYPKEAGGSLRLAGASEDLQFGWGPEKFLKRIVHWHQFKTDLERFR
jgi:hypothetical protein